MCPLVSHAPARTGPRWPLGRDRDIEEVELVTRCSRRVPARVAACILIRATRVTSFTTCRGQLHRSPGPAVRIIHPDHHPEDARRVAHSGQVDDVLVQDDLAGCPARGVPEPPAGVAVGLRHDLAVSAPQVHEHLPVAGGLGFGLPVQGEIEIISLHNRIVPEQHDGATVEGCRGRARGWRRVEGSVPVEHAHAADVGRTVET